MWLDPFSGVTRRTRHDPAGTGLTWTINSLSAGSFVDLTYQATVNLTGPYDNYAEITAHAQYDLDSIPGNGQQTPDEDDDDTVTVVPEATPDLTLDKVYVDYTDNDTSGTITVGDDLNYTVTMTNTGNTTLTNVVVSDPELIPTSQTCASVAPLGHVRING